MLALIYDTETTGLPPKNATSFLQYPMPFQLAFKLCDLTKNKTIMQASAFLIPTDENGDRIALPKEKFFIEQDYTDANLDAWATHDENLYQLFDAALNLADYTVAHNANFDINVTSRWLESKSHRARDTFNILPHYCTMLTMEPILKIPGFRSGTYKWPRLDECYKHFVDPRGFDGAHDAMNDVTALHRLIFALQKYEIVLTPVRALRK